MTEPTPLADVVAGIGAWFARLQAAVVDIADHVLPSLRTPLIGQVRLSVLKADPPNTGWEWAVFDQHPDAGVRAWGRCATHGQAVAVGLARLDEMVMRQRRERQRA